MKNAWIVCGLWAGVLCACSVESEGEPSEVVDLGKADGFETTDAFPAVADLALIVPMDDARVRAVDVMPRSWLGKVYDALEASELGESAEDESFEEDWRLVSARFVPCSALGRVADAEEIDTLCWPQVRLVFQPVLHNIRISWALRDDYADDRAIHALFRVAPDGEALGEVLAALGDGARLYDLPPGVLRAFERERDVAAELLLEWVAWLRDREAGYGRLEMRPELTDEVRADAFYERLEEMLQALCRPWALHELTAFSLPNGRNPASADLWSFVAFRGERGEITQSALEVFDPQTGAPLFAFPSSEDVSTGLGDFEVWERIEGMSDERQAAVLRQVMMDTSELSEFAPRVNDPYQTLVPNVSCSTCHRMNGLNFNFHNLSYLEDQDITIAPRVRGDLVRDVRMGREQWSAR